LTSPELLANVISSAGRTGDTKEIEMTTVRSELARKEAKTGESGCPKVYKIRTASGAFFAGAEIGETVRCTRPASRHRVHEHGSLQF
jgi:hypothetical protein